MNARESENDLPISRSSIASKYCRHFLGRDISETTFLGSNLVHENQIAAHPYGVDVIWPPPYCTHVSKDTGSSSCERKMLRASVYIFFSIFLT